MGIFYNLKGIDGLSKLSLSRINLNNVKDVTYHKRLFKITDRKYPYSLIIDYYKDNCNYNCNCNCNKKQSHYSVIAKRYDSLGDVKKDYDEILKFKKIRENIDIKKYNEFIKSNEIVE